MQHKRFRSTSLTGLAALGLVALLISAPSSVATGSATDRVSTESPAATSFVLAGYNLVWSDEFDCGNCEVPDPIKWTEQDSVRNEPFGPTYWTPDNVYVWQGHLSVRWAGEVGGELQTGALFSNEEWTYGYFEARIRLNDNVGTHGAFWVQNTQQTKRCGNEGNDGTEIDIMESWTVTAGSRVQSALHWDGYQACHKSANKIHNTAALQDGQYHTFGMEWTPTTYKYYVDGVLAWTTSAGEVSDVPQGIRFTGEYMQPTGDFPEWMNVDWVRVYELPGAHTEVPA